MHLFVARLLSIDVITETYSPSYSKPTSDKPADLLHARRIKLSYANV